MNEIQYLGEHLFPGYLGHFSIITAFVAAALSVYAYFQATFTHEQQPSVKNNWLKLGRLSYLTHSFTVILVILLVFYLMTNKFYEYSYVQAHVSDELPFRYIFSAFWEGQEGSFLLWMFWHAILGIILILKHDRFEAHVMAVLALIEVVLTSMLLGIYVTPDLKVGSSLFTLLRETMNLPVFQKADYVSLLQGTGLNPLLQNYWMTIHPPTLFLGFASTSIPFAYACAGLWSGQHRDWLKPAMPWALFATFILGTGILMGSAWAYEALSFGGYWAWDPVENTSLVPWLILVAGLHTNLIANKTGYSIRATYIFYLLSFLLVVYSTLLTRSGWLGDTSVHAFTEMGLETQLVLFICLFFFLGLGLLVAKWKEIPSPKKEEALSSKEFWMFIGSLVFLFSSVLILYSTSLPLINKIVRIFNPDYIGKVINEPVAHYNKYQIWIGVLIGLFSSAAQYLRYRATGHQEYLKKIGLQLALALSVSLAFFLIINLWLELKAWQYLILLFSATFAILANIDSIRRMKNVDSSVWTGALSHIGFGMMIIGILASGVNKKYISSNPFAQKGLLSEEKLGTNVVLFQEQPLYMNGYEVTYTRDTLEGKYRSYELLFKKIDAESAEVTDSFYLYPNGQYNKEFTKMAAFNPDTKHGLTKDIFAFVNIPTIKADIEAYQAQEDSLNYKPLELGYGFERTIVDTFVTEDRAKVDSFRISLDDIRMPPTNPEYQPEPGDLAIGIAVTVNDFKDRERKAEPVIIVRDGLIFHQSAQIDDFSMKVKINDQTLDKLLSPQLDYETVELKLGEKVEKNNSFFSFQGFVKNPDKQAFSADKDDVVAQAKVQVEKKDGRIFSLEPVYLIKNDRPFSIEDRIWEEGIYSKILKINPSDESIVLQLAKTDAPKDIMLEVATNSYRSDFVILEAIEFPGINLFWFGSILLLLGVLLAWWVKFRQTKDLVNDAWR